VHLHDLPLAAILVEDEGLAKRQLATICKPDCAPIRSPAHSALDKGAQLARDYPTGAGPSELCVERLDDGGVSGSPLRRGGADRERAILARE
jgi:hypothetical protein